MDLYRKILSLRKEFIVYLLPPVLIIVNYLVFHLLTDINGSKQGYFSGMIFYWICCLLAVFLLTSKQNRRLLLKIKKPDWWQAGLFLFPVILAFLFGPFRNRINEASFFIIVLSLLYAAVNAISEEFLWRGLYLDHYQGNFFYAVIVPSIWFGIWHYVPLSFQGSSFGNFYFILSAMGIGFCWALVSWYTRSVFWSIISHTLVDWSGLGALYYFN